MRKYLTTLLAGALVLSVQPIESSVAAEAQAQYGEWRSARIGGGGFVVNLLPTSDPQIYYLHTDVGGFYRSDDGGREWRMIHGPLPSVLGSQEPRGLLVDPRDPDTILVAVGSHWSKERDGIYRSNDGGKTYEKTLEAAFAGNGNERMWGTVMAFDPANPDVVLAGAMRDGVFRSEDFGKTWESVGLEGTNPSDIDFDVKTPGRVVLCSMPYDFFLLATPNTKLRRGFFESTDAGKTWTELTDVSPAPFEVAQLSEAFGHDLLGLFPSLRVQRSADGGRTWTDFHQGLPEPDPAGVIDENGVMSPWGAIAPFTFTALAAGPEYVLAGAGDGSVYRRGSGDGAWTKVEGKAKAPDYWFGNDGNRPGWVHFGKATASLVIDPHTPDRWWLCDWYMLWRSDDAGKLWNYSGDGIEVTCIQNVSQVPDDPGMVHLGMGDNGYFRSTDAGNSYAQVWNSQEGGITNNIKDIAVSPKDFDRLYAIGPEVNGHWYSSQVFVSDDRGTSWRSAAMGGTRDVESRRVNTVVADPNDKDTVFVTVAGKPSDQGGVFRSQDAGETFEAINEGLPDEGLFMADIWHVGRELAASSDGSLAAISNYTGQVFAFDPKTRTWTEGEISTIARPNSVAADPFVPGHYLMAAREGGLFESTDAGKTWKNAGLELPAQHVAFDQVVQGRAAVGTEDGVYLTTDGGTEWRRLDGALPNRRANMVGFAGDRVIVGTTGTGVFWLPLTAEAAEPVESTTARLEPEVEAEEVLLNGSFDDQGGEATPAEWTLRWASADGYAAWNDQEFVSAPSSMNLHTEEPGYCVVEQPLPDGLQGKWLEVSGKVRVDGDFEESFVAIQIMNEADEQTEWINIFTPTPDADGWQEFTKTIELPADFATATFLYHANGSGDVWLDDLSAKASDPR